jgi:tetratricopeptide (TPR) repeat protein
MPRSAKHTATSPLALETRAAPTPVRLAAEAMGSGGDRNALNKLNAAIGELKALAVQPLLQNAVNALRKQDHQRGGEWAIKALEQDERSGFGWYMLAIAREMAGDFKGSITCYEAALALLPDHAELASNLGRLAHRLGQFPVAEQLFRHYLARFPDNAEGANNLACALRSQGRFDEAIEVLKATLTRDPAHPIVWNTLGTVMSEQGDPVNALVFFDEALRQDEAFAKARYNRGNMRMAIGDIEGSLVDCETALSQTTLESERQMMRLSRSTILINLGRIGEGWDDYEARLHPQFADSTQFVTDRPAWEPGCDLAGKSLLVMGEQGLGDEILFANVLPDVVEALGPEGRLTIAVEPRLIPLFQRTFPTAEVGPHTTFTHEGRSTRTVPFMAGRLESVDFAVPMGSLLREFRRSVSDFPQRERFLAADPARVAHWREVLKTAPAGKKVGLLWKSAIASAGRHRFFSPFDQWAPILATPGVCFVNLQYGDCAEEIAQARRELGVDIWTPPGIDLKKDLDDLAALTCALDLTVGFANATSNIAAACGAPCWLISTPGAWPRVGTDHYPWYPQMRVFLPPGFRQWAPVMGEVAQALGEFTAS